MNSNIVTQNYPVPINSEVGSRKSNKHKFTHNSQVIVQSIPLPGRFLFAYRDLYGNVFAGIQFPSKKVIEFKQRRGRMSRAARND